jgi:large subunit ribosomal protein L9
MEVILTEDIQGLGYKNDLVQVKGGYGRNYLIPKGLALAASESNKKRIAENVKQASHKAEKIRQDAESLAQTIGEVVLEISTKAGENGKIFGAVTALQISDALKSRGFEVDRKKISFKAAVKTLGDYTAVLDLHRDVKHEVNFKVVEA